MDYLDISYKGASAHVALFACGRSEAHAYIHPADTSAGHASQLQAMAEAAGRLCAELGMSPAFMRWLLSDPANQASLLPRERVCATSVIGQPPLDGSKAALLLIMAEDAPFEDQGDGMWLDSHGRLWVGDDDSPTSGDSLTMTADYLQRLDTKLKGMGASLKDNCLRTWLFVRDIDNNYAGVVRGRNEVFERLGLTRDSHFIASTGIEGSSAAPSRSVSFNAVADINLDPKQITHLYGRTHLNPTYEYGVAFERATAVDYADRRDVYISGTASIDRHGRIVAPGDIKAQTERMLENIGVLLAEAGCGWSDVAHLTVYLRDIADFRTVSDMIEARFHDIPKAIVLAPVCRPGWLVEAECMAVRHPFPH